MGDEVSDYETAPAMPEHGGFGGFPFRTDSDLPPHTVRVEDGAGRTVADFIVNETTGEVHVGRVLEPAAAETSIERVQSDVIENLVDGGTDALDVFRDPESVRRLSHDVRNRLLEQLEQYAATHRAARPAGRRRRHCRRS